jgi:signal transduction histidine kinase
MTRETASRIGTVIGTVAVVSLLHYSTALHHDWLHAFFQRAYYVAVLLGAMWFGWRGGLFAAALSALAYTPFIITAWSAAPAYQADQFVEVGMFFVVGVLAGTFFDHEKRQRITVEETARRLSEVYAQLQASFEQLRRADRLSALGELSAGLAHEIRNPLGSIEGAVQILRRPNLAEDTKQEFGKLAADEVDRLKGLLTNFLQFARPQAPRRRVTMIKPLLEAVRGLTEETAKMGGCRVRVDSPGELLSVTIDPDQIKQLLLDLLLNAVQAMPEGGEVVLRASKRPDAITIEVQDEGVGIDPENLEKIFDPFFTTRPNGTGLGLSIAYQIVRQHQGRLEVLRNPGRGMTFVVLLPLDLGEKAGDSEVLSTFPEL